jgi:hypothetical protein
MGKSKVKWANSMTISNLKLEAPRSL